MSEILIEEHIMPSGKLYSHIKGNALDLAEKDGYCMIHCCNAQGVMGSGIALQVKNRFPEAYLNYMKNHRLGSVTSDANIDYKVNVIDYKVNVFNLVAQEFYGKECKRYLDYGALGCCLMKLMNNFNCFLQDAEVNTIVIPHKFGSDRAGADWNIVIEMCRFILGSHFNILVVEI